MAKPTAAARFRDRIVGLVWAAPARLKRHPENWRRHPDEQRTAFRAVLEEIGIAGAAVAFIADDKARRAMQRLRTREKRATWLAAYKGRLTLIDGHLRKEEIAQPIPTIVLDVGPEEARKALATHDAVTALATAKRGALVALAERAGFRSDTITLALAAVQQRYVTPLAELVTPPGGAGGGHQADDDDDEPIVPTDALVKKWGTALGQLWVVPSLSVPGREHRLMCGDSTVRDNLVRLHDGVRPDLGLHDPPYGISAVHTNKRGTKKGGVSNPKNGKKRKTVFAPIAGDASLFDPTHLLGAADIDVLWGANCFPSKLPPSAEWIVWMKISDTAEENDFSAAELAYVSPPPGRKGHVRRIAFGGSRGAFRSPSPYRPSRSAGTRSLEPRSPTTTWERAA